MVRLVNTYLNITTPQHSFTTSPLLIYPLYLRSAVVMQQDLVVVIALGTHYCGTNLAESYAVSPAGTCEAESLWHAVLDIILVYDERTAVEVRVAQCATYLQLLADGECALRTHNFSRQMRPLRPRSIGTRSRISPNSIFSFSVMRLFSSSCVYVTCQR